MHIEFGPLSQVIDVLTGKHSEVLDSRPPSRERMRALADSTTVLEFRLGNDILNIIVASGDDPVKLRTAYDALPGYTDRWRMLRYLRDEEIIGMGVAKDTCDIDQKFPNLRY